MTLVGYDSFIGLVERFQTTNFVAHFEACEGIYADFEVCI